MIPGVKQHRSGLVFQLLLHAIHHLRGALAFSNAGDDGPGLRVEIDLPFRILMTADLFTGIFGGPIIPFPIPCQRIDLFLQVLRAGAISLRLRNRSGTVSIAQKFTMSSAPTEPT